MTRRRCFFIFPPVAFIASFLLLLLLPDLPDRVGLNPDLTVSRAVIRVRAALIPQRCPFESPSAAFRRGVSSDCAFREAGIALFHSIYLIIIVSQ
jgi:hypothetical protein